MSQPIQTFYLRYNELHDFLLNNGELSLSVDLDHHYRKIYLLSCASYYETQIINIIKDFISTHSSDSKILFFTTKKAIERQYHTYFDWEPNSNINKFLSMFGPEFKDSVSEEIKRSAELSLQALAFQIIGGERNKMVHQNFLEYNLDKTFPELIDLSTKASKFVEYLQLKFSE